ncbi:MAG: D-alanyl-D-alanine carboxypeptidase/D-alanyl-D-alanine-endopeptidase [Planctomycetota bacterium]
MSSVLVALLALVPLQDRSDEPKGLGLDAIVAEAEKLDVRTGVYVRLLKHDAPDYRHRSEESFSPASNHKLFTAALVCEELGAEHRFVERFRWHAEEGVLAVTAGGHPLLGLDGKPAFAGLGAELKQRGISEVALRLDPGPFKGPARPDGWPDNQTDRWYEAPTGPFVLDEGCVTLILDPKGAERGPCALAFEPVGLDLPVDGEILLTSDKAKGGVFGALVREQGIKVWGRYWSGAQPRRERIACDDPELVYRSVLASELAAAGVRITDPAAPAPRSEGETVHEVEAPLSGALARMLGESINFTAEQCLRIVAGRHGEASLAAGRELLQKRFAGTAPRAEAWHAADGSGLSRGNLTSPLQVGKLLAEVYGRPWREAYVASLPRSGVSGSLLRRLQGEMRGRVLAKTGWIAGASSLSGYVRCESGEVAVFSILMNYNRRRGGLNKALKDIQDRIVVRIKSRL